MHKAANIIWFILGGFLIVAFYLVYGAFLCLTIVGIPFAKQHIKLIPVALLPFNYTLRK